jgi:hypothetical protein
MKYNVLQLKIGHFFYFHFILFHCPCSWPFMGLLADSGPVNPERLLSRGVLHLVHVLSLHQFDAVLSVCVEHAWIFPRSCYFR